MSQQGPDNSFGQSQRLAHAKTEFERNPLDLIAIVDGCVIGVCVNDWAGNFIHVNEAYSHIYGYKPEELLGKNFTIMAPSEDRHEVWQAIFDDFIEEGKEMAGEWVVKRRDGKLLTIYTDAVRIGNPETGYQKVTFVNDITSLKMLQQDSVNSRQSFSHLFEQPYTLCLLADPESLHVSRTNKALAKLAGEAIVVGVDLKLALTPASGSWKDVVEQARQQPGGKEFEFRWNHGIHSTVPGYVNFVSTESKEELLLTLKA